MRYLILLSIMLISCGKVAQDISSQSEKSIFKTAKFSIQLPQQLRKPWQDLISTANVSKVYAQYNGVKLDSGITAISWASADIEFNTIASNNIATVINHDKKRNVISSARYQQGVFSLQKTSTTNYKLNTEFKKIRPKYSYYIASHFISKDDAIHYVSETIPTSNRQITPYDHLISSLFIQHLNKESYNKDALIPISMFTNIIPTSAITPSLNIYPKNKIKRFKPEHPSFSYQSPLFDALIGTVSLTHFSDEIDTLDFIKQQQAFSEPLKKQLKNTVQLHFKSKLPPKNTTNTTTSPNATISGSATIQATTTTSNIK